MPKFNLAVRTRRGLSDQHDWFSTYGGFNWVSALETWGFAVDIDAPTWAALTPGPRFLSDVPAYLQTPAGIQRTGQAATANALHARLGWLAESGQPLAPLAEGGLLIYLDDGLTLDRAASPGLLHYFRLADATLIPLPPEYEPARHKLVPGKAPGGPLKFSAGDAYIAVSPGVGRVTDSPAMARFLHLRDYFNAEKLAEALLAHIVELAGTDELPEDVTVLVVEAR